LIEATIDFEADGIPRATFTLAYDPRWARKLIRKIFARHFERLGLARRLRQSSFKVIGKIKPEVLNCRKLSPGLQETDILGLLADKATELSGLSGANHIEPVLYRAASKSLDFIRYCLQNQQPIVLGATP
jgi:hypothetical protein